ncbi:FHA domain-containing protein [Microcystis aeruginosa]|uniref:FHA domain-containing protein n=1 Tax=Microcystis aeruginosa TaxID=1126 RepID=UPI0023313A1C|nr:FHA domain-containing protein [Microcystis aeruginosa]MDB9434719.1 FHA domain-containing protein [Microcystis aeruginosa CS-552/01]
MSKAFLLHEETGTLLEISGRKNLFYLGKVNPKVTVDLNLSHLPNAEIVSRVHAIIYVEEDGFYLEDAGSLNGTYLNGENLQSGRKKLKSGDRITLGYYRAINLLFEIESANPPQYTFKSLAN